MAHYRGNLLTIRSRFDAYFYFLFPYNLFCQAAQLTHIVDGRMKELSEDAELGKALKDVAKAMAKEKVKAAETAEKKAAAVEKARVLAKSKFAELKV